MTKLAFAISVLAAFAACSPSGTGAGERKDDTIDKTAANDSSRTVVNDTTPKITGVGGIFFFSDNPEQARNWYSQNLGIETNEYGSTFESRNVKKPEQIDRLQWAIFKTGSKYFAPSKKDFMINYQVQNIEGMVRKLKANGATVLDSIAAYDYGKFVHVLDPEGNKIELWEPARDEKK
jgi:predicted enzyme related to lactoylglutathione lyase